MSFNEEEITGNINDQKPILKNLKNNIFKGISSALHAPANVMMTLIILIEHQISTRWREEK
jgi:hypothetical protein